MRIDRFLWFARIVPSRKFAQAMASAGTLRIDGRAINRPAAPVRVGAILAFVTHGGRVRVLRVEALPLRRGPAVEAAALYTELANPG